MPDPVKVIFESLVFQCPYFQILDRYCELPDGSKHHFYIRKETDTCCVLALTQEGKFIVEKQYRIGPDKELYQLPAGRLENFDDNPDKRIHNELLEETGYEGELKKIGEMPTSPYSTRTIHCYYAVNCKKVADQQLDEGEVLSVEFLSKDEMYEVLMSGQSSSCAPGLLAWEWLKRDGHL